MKITSLKNLFAAFVLFCAVIGGASVSRADTGSAGKEFYIGFPAGYGGGDVNVLSLFISGKSNTKGSISIEGLNYKKDFVVTANTITTVILPNAQFVAPNVITKKGIRITSEQDVTVYGLNQATYTSDAFLALPVSALGLEYYALTYAQTIGLPAQAAIIGAYDATQVTITPASDLVGHAAGVPFSITLNKGETYLLTSQGEVTGTRIVANVPVAVMSGVEGVYIPKNFGGGDVIIEMMPPVSTWGKSFLTVPLATRLKGDFFRILASEDNTAVKINGVHKVTLARGQFYETVLTTRSEITTSAPALVSQFAASTTFDNVEGDPFSMLIPPAEQFLDSYIFSTPLDRFPRQFVNVVIPTAAVSSLRMDGNVIASNLFSAIGASGFSGGQVPASAGSHTIASVDNVPFGIYVYGFGTYESYGYPGGMSFKAINPAGDPYKPSIRLVQAGNLINASATDSEDTNANGVLDAGEDLNGNSVIDRRNEDLNANGKLDPGEDANGNAILDRDTGIFQVVLAPNSTNLSITVLPFVPGSTAAQFRVERVDLSKPGIGSVQVVDGAGNQTTVPVEIGAIPVMLNVRIIATLPAEGMEIDSASFKKPPHSIASGPDRQTIEWRFDTFNADSSADLDFDVIFKNPIAGEQREVTRQVDIFYTDANGKEQHAALGPRVVDVLSTAFNITPRTDKPTYVDGDFAQITSLVKSLTSVQGAVGVKISILDANRAVVADLGKSTFQTILAGATATFADAHLIVKGLYVGNYTVAAELFDSNGVTVARGSAQFSVVAGSAPTLSAKIATNKQTYNSRETVVVTDKLTSLTRNQTYENLLLTTSVLKPDGTVLMTTSANKVQLSAEAVRQFQYNVALVSAAPGTYLATLKVSAGDGTLLTQSSTSFVVASDASTGNGLTGSITATPQKVPQGESVAFAYSVNNLGNSILTDLPLSVTIVNPKAQEVKAEFPVTRTVAMGATYRGDVNWITSGQVDDTFVAVLGANVAGKTVALAQTNFTLLPAVAKLEISQTLRTGSRVLVLVSCNDGESETPGAGGKPAVCVNDRVRTIAEMLGALGITHLMTTDETSFRKALRSGAFNTYWISGKQDKLHGSLAEEVRELVFGGDALILDGVHDQRNKTIDAVSAVLHRGKIGLLDLPVRISGADFTQQVRTMAGRGEKILLDGAVAQAAFDGAHPQAHGTAIATHRFGEGHGVLFAFDMVRSYSADPLWGPVLGSAFAYAMPALPAVWTPGSLVEMDTRITNLNQPVQVEVKTTAPPGATIVATNPLAAVNSTSNTADWTFGLAAAASNSLGLSLRVPQAEGEMLISTAVSTAWKGTSTQYGNVLSLPIQIAGTVSTSTATMDELLALDLPNGKAPKVRNDIIAAVREAAALIAHGTGADCEKAINLLVDAGGQLDALPADTKNIRLHLDRLLRGAQLRWTAQQP